MITKKIKIKQYDENMKKQCMLKLNMMYFVFKQFDRIYGLYRYGLPNMLDNLGLLFMLWIQSLSFLMNVQYKVITSCNYQQFVGMRGGSPQSKQLLPPQQKQSKMINDNQKSEMIRLFMSQVKTEDLLNIAFMKPIEVALRTNRTDKEIPTDSLPQGLMQVIKENGINDNKYNLQRFQPVTPFITSLEALKTNSMDNYISLLKKPNLPEGTRPETILIDEIRTSQARNSSIPSSKHTGLELGICVSMKKEDKKILKKSLTGIAQNIDELVRSGVSPDDIFVVVMIDGVKNVDKSLYEYFQEFERESDTFIDEDEQLTLKKKYENYQYHQEIEKEEQLNYSKFLFKPFEFEERVERKFQRIRTKYDEILRIKNSIQNIKKQHNKDNDNLKMILNKMIDKQKNILKKIKSDKKILINQESIMKELASGQQQCNQYINSREPLAYVSAYRLRIASMCPQLKENETKLTLERSSMIEGQFQTERMFDDELMERGSEQQRPAQTNKKTIRYVNLFFCIKYKESGKLSSHNWFFNGFCKELNPKYAVILDAGVRPYKDAIFKMYRCMKMNQKIGSVCGYRRLVQQKVEQQDEAIKYDEMDCMSSMLTRVFDIQRAQQIENHYEHLLDKPFEAIFGYIHVLPGSFSAYNMQALQPVGTNDDLLKEYFKSMDDKISSNKITPTILSGGQLLSRVLLPKTISKYINRIDPDSEQQLLYNENVNLAEDRVLSLGIHKNDMDIAFMPDVYAQVQPIKMINDLMGSKKKQINGAAYSFENVRKELGDSDSKRTSFFVRFQLFYLSFMKFLSSFAPALLIFILQFAFEIIKTEFLKDVISTQNPKGIGNVIYGTITTIIVFWFVVLIGCIMFYSLHLDHKNKKFIYFAYLATTIAGILSTISFLVFFVQTVQGFTGKGDYLRTQYFNALENVIPGYGLLFVNALRYFLGAAVFFVIFPVFIYSVFFRKFGILWDLFVGTPAYIFYFPTYSIFIPLYARCKIDEISSARGNMGAKFKQSWKILKLVNVSKYLFWNTILAGVLITLHGYILIKFFALLFLLLIFSIISLIKIVPVLFYTISYKCKMSNNPLKPTDAEVLENSSAGEIRVFSVIKTLEESLRFEIEQSFKLAAEDIQYKKQTKSSPSKEKKENKDIKKQGKQAESKANHLSRQSIKIMNNFQSNKLASIRDSTVPKGVFYPGQFGNARVSTKPGGINPIQSNTPLEMVLLKQKLGKEASTNIELKDGAQKLQKFDAFRTTLSQPILKPK